jgi:hypothetical protein
MFADVSQNYRKRLGSTRMNTKEREFIEEYSTIPQHSNTAHSQRALPGLVILYHAPYT